MNDPFVVQQARRLGRAALLAGRAHRPSSGSTTLYQTAFGRPPDRRGDAPTPSTSCSSSRSATATRLDDPRAWADLCHVLINVKEFIFVELRAESACHCRRFVPPPLTRRDMLLRCANGFGAVALAALLADAAPTAATCDAMPPARPAGAAAGHHPAKAKSVIFLYMDGGPSQVDTFDPKPRLDASTASRSR